MKIWIEGNFRDVDAKDSVAVKYWDENEGKWRIEFEKTRDAKKFWEKKVKELENYLGIPKVDFLKYDNRVMLKAYWDEGVKLRLIIVGCYYEIKRAVYEIFV